ncbi:MAG: hypothetical protein ACI4L9_07010 [Candidatus Coproplasma sp.]
MFETYYYIDEEKIDCYLSDFSRSTKHKKFNLSLEVTLPFIKVTANGEFSKDISDLSPRQKAILFESILENNSLELLFDLSDPNVDIDTLGVNTFIKISTNLRVPEMVDMINGMGDFLSSRFGGIAQEKIVCSQDEESANLLATLFSEKQLSVPILTGDNHKTVSEIDIEKLIDCDELDFWDEVADGCEIIAKVTKNYYGGERVKVVDLGKTYFGLSRGIRHKIPNYENDPQYNIFENNVKLRLEILAIKK